MSQNIEYIVAMGNIGDGITFYGPFTSSELAINWASENDNGEPWEVYSVYEPMD